MVYVGIQIRDSNRVNQANARHNISDFVLQVHVSLFNAGHADRSATIQEKAAEGKDLSGAEKTFQWWSHMSLMLHAETYFHHYELGLMPDGHWKGYVRYIESCSVTPGFVDFWSDVDPTFSSNFCDRMTEIANRKNDLNLPNHHDA